MPDANTARYNSVLQPPANDGISSSSNKVAADDSPNSTSSSRASISSQTSVPCPFDSHSSLEEIANEDTKERTLGKRIRRAFHLYKSYPAGHAKGTIDQIIRSLSDYPVGYSKVAGIENLDPDFLIYKKFGWLHNYALLHLHDELNELQDELEAFDRWESKDGEPRRMTSRRLDYGRQVSRRRELMSQIHQKLQQYDEALLRMRDIQALKRPTARTQRNVHNLVMNSENLTLEESEWIREGPDLAALGYGGDHGWLNAFLEDLLNFISRRFTKAVFRSQEQKIKSGFEAVQLVSPDRLDAFLRVVITVIASILLLAPIYILFKLQPYHRSDVEKQSNYQILTVFLFTLIFSASCSIFTQAKRQEVFAATAAYAAVLVVFLGNTSNVLLQNEDR